MHHKTPPRERQYLQLLGQEARLLGASETQSFGDGIGGWEGKETGLYLKVEPRQELGRWEDMGLRLAEV